MTPWHLPGVHQRQRQEADCWGWLRCQCCWLQGLNCDDEKKTKKSLSLKTLLEGGHYFRGELVPGPAPLPPWWILHKHRDVLGWRLAHKDTLCQGFFSVREMEVVFSQTIYAHTSYLSWDCHTFSRHRCGKMMLNEVVLPANCKMQPGQAASPRPLTCLNRYMVLTFGFLHTCMVKDELGKWALFIIKIKVTLWHTKSASRQFCLSCTHKCLGVAWQDDPPLWKLVSWGKEQRRHLALNMLFYTLCIYFTY